NITAKIAGGAHMFNNGVDINIQIGHRNIEAVCQVLNDMDIKIVAKDVGEDYGRTMEFYTEDGKVLVRSYKKGKKFL
ncbi:MAG TPA: chemotaxis protein CheD, partial [Halanaerobiales bacterium]|nr:chemotaxis protein CheD [Halanaerobiales bacterium]